MSLLRTGREIGRHHALSTAILQRHILSRTQKRLLVSERIKDHLMTCLFPQQRIVTK